MSVSDSLSSRLELTPQSWHSLTSQQVCDFLQSDLGYGLTQAQAQQRLLQYGKNELEKEKRRTGVKIFFSQFKSLVVILLLAAGIISLLLAETLEAFSILVVILINGIIGFLTEWKAERTILALQQQIFSTAEVVREGESHRIPSAELVPGDLIILQAGDKIPADGRLVEVARLQVEESALTGESVAANKNIDRIEDKDITIGDRLNMGFMGTTVVAGRGRLIVTDTGAKTEIGKVGTLLKETKRPITILEQRISELGKVLILVLCGICAVVVLLGWFKGIAFLKMLEIGISLAIAAVPEGLPAVVTMTLALGMQRMARRGVIIRNLPAVETLGSVSTICVDKTGTLTKNEMEVQILLAGQKKVDFAGDHKDIHSQVQGDTALKLALEIAALCNDAHTEHLEKKTFIHGDPTEAALLVAAERGGLKIGELHRDYPRIDEVPFDSRAKLMVTVHRTKEGKVIAMIKGAPGTLLELSSSYLNNKGKETLTEQARSYYLQANKEYAEKSLRILGLAFRELSPDYHSWELEKDFIFVGIIGMLDPLRPTAKNAIEHCRKAGIWPIMLTGDQLTTAAAIGKELGLEQGLNGQKLDTIHARELENKSPTEISQITQTSSVFARVSPKHKLQIVSALQDQGDIVAMTGDGVNDAPALKQADIGIVMASKGSEVAKETADMLITDDNFESIVAAVQEGRVIYANILKFIHYLFSCNFAEILTVFVAILLGLPLPLTALQILWLNIVTDIFPALALALEPSASDLMMRRPRDSEQGFLNKSFLILIAWQSALLAAVSLLAFSLALSWYGIEEEGTSRAVTICFLTLSGAQIVHVFNTRSRKESGFGFGLFRNIWLWGAIILCLCLQYATVSVHMLQRALHTVQPAARDWLLVIICSIVPVAFIEIYKFFNKRFIK